MFHIIGSWSKKGLDISWNIRTPAFNDGTLVFTRIRKSDCKRVTNIAVVLHLNYAKGYKTFS